MQHSPMTDADVGFNDQWSTRIGVQQGPILDVATCPDIDGFVVSSQDCLAPDTGFIAQNDFADQGRAFFDKSSGRLQGNRVVPYFSRADIELEDSPLQGQELLWVNDPVELFFLQIQGSGVILLPNGQRLHVGYADQNGYPFRSIARYLIDHHQLTLAQTSMQGIKSWARQHPRELQTLLNQNPSYVFFRLLPPDLAGPLGTLGVPLTGQASLAIDPHTIPLGVPVLLSTQEPGTQQPLTRLMMAQDTGGAIRGAVRADFFWGFGPHAEQAAGHMKEMGRLWVLYPHDHDPNSPQ